MSIRWCVVGILSVTAVCHWVIQGAQDRATREAPAATLLGFPSEFGGYRRVGEDLPVEQHVRDLLQTSSILMRTYTSPKGWPVQLAIVHADTTRRSLHFPEVCLVGQGWEIREQYTSPVGFSFVARRLVLVKGNHQEAVLYWFKTGENMTGSYFENSVNWAWQKLMFRAPSSSMIRLSTPVGRGGPEPAFAQLDDFATQLVPVVQENLP